MKLTTTIISDPDKITDFKEDIEEILNYGSNPFSLLPFIQNTTIPKNSVPAYLVSKIGSKTVAFAPLMLKHKHGIRIASFLQKCELSPDFLITEEYREAILEHFIQILFYKLHCSRIELNLPDESPNLKPLMKICSNIGSSHMVKRHINDSHSIIFINTSWEEFVKKRGGRFRKKFKVTERDLTKIGEWKITHIGKSSDDHMVSEAITKVFDIEKLSWKQTWRLNAGQTSDDDLLCLWKSLAVLQKSNPNFDSSIWLLELNNKPVAYCIIIQYAGTAFIAKTSYIEQYKSLHLGYYIINAAIKDLFNQTNVRTIDFMTNLYFMKIWTSTYHYRNTILLHNGKISSLIEKIIAETSVILKAVTNARQKYPFHLLNNRILSRSHLKF
jgi:hypothetical protein